MAFDAQRLYELLPAIHRIRDSEQGEPLKALLEVIAEQVAVLEEDLAQLYDDHFIETCAEWVVPYIGHLVGARLAHPLTAAICSQRAQVAHTLAYRRRKGTAAVLEQLARDVTGWPARVVEFFQLLATTQYLNHLRPGNHYAPDLRQHELLEQLNTPFDRAAHTLEVRHAASGRGKYNIPHVGLFLWRLTPYSLTQSPACKLDDQRFFFHPLGCNSPLFRLPPPEGEIEHVAEPVHVPAPIGRAMLRDHLADYYGADKSLCLFRDGHAVGIDEVQVCDLSDAGGGGWAHKPVGKIGIDPVLGRIALGDGQNAGQTLSVLFHYGFSADLGGGEYERAGSIDTELAPLVPVKMPDSIADRLVSGGSGGTGVTRGAVEVVDSGRYEEALTVTLRPEAGAKLELRARNGVRPAILLKNRLEVKGKPDADVTLSGLLIAGGAVHVGGSLRRLRLLHCTLVPGLLLAVTGGPQHPGEPSLIVESQNTLIEIDHCILGGLYVAGTNQVVLTHSILDATAPERLAYAGDKAGTAGAPLRVENSTLIGQVRTTRLDASNTIFLAEGVPPAGWDHPLHVERRQEGCVRFSYVPPGARVPRRYRCQPVDAVGAVHLCPEWTSLRYSQPGYCQLRRLCAAEIRQGADDEAEMGAFHDLYQPQRESNLRAALDEYLRFGLEAGIFFVS